MAIVMRAYLNVTSLDVQRRFWVSTLGAAEAGASAVELPGLRIEMRAQPPTGGTRGTALDHLGFQVPDLAAMVERVRAAGYPIITRESLPAAIDVDDQGLAPIPAIDTRVAFTLGPDDLKVEFLEYPGPPIALHHVHLFGPDPTAMRDWYVRELGAVATVRGRFVSGELAGVRLSFSQTASPLTPTAGRTIDRVAFDVPGAAGPTTVDPWGAAIEIGRSSRA